SNAQIVEHRDWITAPGNCRDAVLSVQQVERLVNEYCELLNDIESTLRRQIAQRGRKMSTIRRARIAIEVMHADAGAARPDRGPRIRTLEHGIGKTLGTKEEGARPLLLEDLERIMGVLGARPRD